MSSQAAKQPAGDVSTLGGIQLGKQQLVRISNEKHLNIIQ